MHNGTAVGVTKSQRVERARRRRCADVYSVMRTEPNGVVEGYGGTAAGDFSIAVPAGLAFDTGVNSSVSRVGDHELHRRASPASTSRSAPPTRRRPARSDSFASSREPTVANLSWDAVADADELHRVPVAGPDADRRRDQLHVAAARPSGPPTTTSYSVTGLTEGQDYHFAVRAVDAATNAGPLSRYPVELDPRHVGDGRRLGQGRDPERHARGRR